MVTRAWSFHSPTRKGSAGAPQRGLIELEEEVTAAGLIGAHDLGVERGQEAGDAGVEGGEGEAALVAQAGEDPALGDLHGDLRLGLLRGWRGRAGRIAVP